MKETKKDPNVGTNPLEADATSKYRKAFLEFGEGLTENVTKAAEVHPKEVSVIAIFMVGDQIASFLHGSNGTLKNMVQSCLETKNQDSLILHKAFKDYMMGNVLSDVVKELLSGKGVSVISKKPKAKKDGAGKEVTS